jgi:hypothetical protein
VPFQYDLLLPLLRVPHLHLFGLGVRNCQAPGKAGGSYRSMRKPAGKPLTGPGWCPPRGRSARPAGGPGGGPSPRGNSGLPGAGAQAGPSHRRAAQSGQSRAVVQRPRRAARPRPPRPQVRRAGRRLCGLSNAAGQGPPTPAPLASPPARRGGCPCSPSPTSSPRPRRRRRGAARS